MDMSIEAFKRSGFHAMTPEEIVSDWSRLIEEIEQLRAENASLKRTIDLANQFDEADDDAEWAPPHPIFKMALDVDLLKAENAELTRRMGIIDRYMGNDNKACMYGHHPESENWFFEASKTASTSQDQG